jgi:hypothetical protein
VKEESRLSCSKWEGCFHISIRGALPKSNDSREWIVIVLHKNKIYQSYAPVFMTYNVETFQSQTQNNPLRSPEKSAKC